MDEIRKLLRAVPDFPKKGILFQDIFPILEDAQASKQLVDFLTAHIRGLGRIDVLIGLDSRGFLLGPWIASNLGVKFVPIRKAGKLPPPVHSVTYTLEYGSDSFEISKSAVKKGERVVVLDDLIATGGSACAAAELIKLCGGVPVEYVFLIELTFLKGRDKLDADTFSLFKFDD